MRSHRGDIGRVRKTRAGQSLIERFTPRESARGAAAGRSPRG
ncbi:MAG: hypothetical protein JWR47_3276 [Phenylobacterium sp.]|nr:hypothetical protein [Phenylobacterium sp.]